MSTTTSTSDLAWTGVEVLYATDSSGAATVTLWNVPATAASTNGPTGHTPDLDALRKVSEDHARSVADGGDWRAGEPTAHADGAGGSYLVRHLSRPHPSTDVALAGYWSTPSGISVAVASYAGEHHGGDLMGDPNGDTAGNTHGSALGAPELTRVLEDFMAASWPTFSLSAEEILVLCQVTDLAVPPVSPSSYAADSPDEVRTAAHTSALASLVARGLLAPGDQGMQPPTGLHRALRLLLDGERSLLLSVQRPDGNSTTLLGGRGARLAVLAPGAHGSLVLSTTGPQMLLRRYAAWLAAQRADPPEGEPFRAPVASVRAAVNGSPTDGSTLSGARQLVTLRGLRRTGEDLSVLDSTWLEDADGGLWSVTATEDPAMALLHPVAGSSMPEALADAVGFSAP